VVFSLEFHSKVPSSLKEKTPTRSSMENIVQQEAFFLVQFQDLQLLEIFMIYSQRSTTTRARADLTFMTHIHIHNLMVILPALLEDSQELHHRVGITILMVVTEMLLQDKEATVDHLQEDINRNKASTTMGITIHTTTTTIIWMEVIEMLLLEVMVDLLLDMTHNIISEDHQEDPNINHNKAMEDLKEDMEDHHHCNNKIHKETSNHKEASKEGLQECHNNHQEAFQEVDRVSDHQEDRCNHKEAPNNHKVVSKEEHHHCNNKIHKEASNNHKVVSREDHKEDTEGLLNKEDLREDMEDHHRCNNKVASNNEMWVRDKIRYDIALLQTTLLLLFTIVFSISSCLLSYSFSPSFRGSLYISCSLNLPKVEDLLVERRACTTLMRRMRQN
jgi:hypothetical protein